MRPLSDVIRAHRGLTGFVAGVLATGVLVGGGAAIAAIPSTTTGDITGCVNKRTGLVRLVDVQARQTCTTAERAVVWNKGYRYRGAWSAATTYGVGDVVTAGGSSYLARSTSRNRPPATSTTAWGLLAAAGAVGSTGAQGPAGPAGPAGAAGPTGAKGDPGTTGQQGLQGAAGAQGLVGPAGPTGSPGPSGPPGTKGDPGTTGSQGLPGLPGPAGAGGIRGQRFWSDGGTYTWTAPTDVTGVLVELWAGGGGGGCGGAGTNGLSGGALAGGGGGGSGAAGSWSRTFVPVTPGVTYTVSIGAAGARCLVGTQPAGAGGTTTFTGPGPGTVSLAVPGGGPGGNGQDYTSFSGNGGANGQPVSATEFIFMASTIFTQGSFGTTGTYGGVGEPRPCGSGALATPALPGSVSALFGRGGGGGDGGCQSVNRNARFDVKAGGAVLVW